MASVAASAAASAATAAVQAASPAVKDKDKDKSKGDEETPVRPWTEGDYPSFDVNGLHPDELRLASLPRKRREELGAASRAVHQQGNAARQTARPRRSPSEAGTAAATSWKPTHGPTPAPPRSCSASAATAGHSFSVADTYQVSAPAAAERNGV